MISISGALQLRSVTYLCLFASVNWQGALSFSLSRHSAAQVQTSPSWSSPVISCHETKMLVPATEESSKMTNDGITKLPPIPQGATVQKRMLPTKISSSRDCHRIHVSPKTPFRSITTRVRKQLDKNLRTASSSTAVFANKLASRKHASLDERVRAIQRHGSDSGIGIESSGEVLVLGTGRAIEKAILVANFFQKQRDCIVRIRTTSVGAIDDVIVEDDGEFGGDTRFRMLSALEVSIKLR